MIFASPGGNLISNRLIDPKIGLNVGYGVVHVRKAWFFVILIASCKFMQLIKFVCTVLTDLLTRFCWKLIYMYVLRWCMSERVDLKKQILLVFANLCNLRFFCEYICVHGFDWSTNPILLTIDIHNMRFMMMHVWSNWLQKNIIGIVANLCNFQFFANIFVSTVLTDLLTWFYWTLIFMYVMRWCMSEIIDFFKITIGGCNLCNLRLFAN